MKRSSQITLAILGALALTSCADPSSQSSSTSVTAGPTTYANLEECVKDNDYSTCKAAEEQAKKQTAESAPRYATADQCQAQFSNCQKSDSGDWFMPAVMGYMVGSMMSDGSRGYASPVYYDRGGNAVRADFSGGSYKPATAAPTYASQAPARAAAASRASTASRGGFGSRSSSSSS